jgi:hypothetical protein
MYHKISPHFPDVEIDSFILQFVKTTSASLAISADSFDRFITHTATDLLIFFTLMKLFIGLLKQIPQFVFQ